MLQQQWEEKLSLPLLLMKAIYHNITGKDKFRIIDYGDYEDQYLMYFEPKKNRKDCLLFFLHGGGWRMGDPEFFKFIGNFFASKGFSTILPGYRLAPEFNFPAQMNDVFAAFKAGIKTASQYNVNTDQVFIVGQSAGAHLGALLAFNQHQQAEYQISQDNLAGFVSISGPLDLSVCQTKEGRQLLANFLAEPEDEAEANPINYLSGEEEVPVLCFHGQQDPLVEVESPQSFLEKLNGQEKETGQLKIIDQAHHSELVELFFANNKYKESKLLIDWLNSKL